MPEQRGRIIWTHVPSHLPFAASERKLRRIHVHKEEPTQGKPSEARGGFAASVLPGLATARVVAEGTDLSLMELGDAAF